MEPIHNNLLIHNELLIYSLWVYVYVQLDYRLAWSVDHLPYNNYREGKTTFI